VRHPKSVQVRESRAHENRIAALVAGRRLPASGALAWGTFAKGVTAGGDVSSPTFHIEHKFTRNNKLVVQREWLQKVSYGADRVSKFPALVLTFVTDQVDNVVHQSAIDKLFIPEGVTGKVCHRLAPPWNAFQEAQTRIPTIETDAASTQISKDAGIIRYVFSFSDVVGRVQTMAWFLVPFQIWIPALRGEA